MKKRNYWISPSQNGWKVQKERANKASRIFDTQKKAENYARKLLLKNEGGELITQNKGGIIRSKDTINSLDLNPPKDKEH